MDDSCALVNPRASRASDFDELVDTKTAARVLGLRNFHTLEVWRSTNRYPTLRYFRVGRAVRYRRSELFEFLDANQVGGSPTRLGSGDARR